MSNFLDYIRTIFKLSGSQAFPTNKERITLTNSETSGLYTAPYDGYFGIYNNTNASFCDIYSTSPGGIGRKTSFRYSAVTTASGTIPVRKGDVVHWLSNVAITEMWFIPSASSD